MAQVTLPKPTLVYKIINKQVSIRIAAKYNKIIIITIWYEI